MQAAENGSQNHAEAQRAAKKRWSSQKHCGSTGVWNQTFEDGEQVAAGFSAIHRGKVRPQAKYAVIYYHRKEYAATVSKFFEVSRSGHHRFVGRLGRSEKDAALAEKIFQQHNKCIRIYGYCRMWQSLKSSAGFYHNSKIILRVMKQYDLLSEIHRRKNWQQMGDNCTNTITSLTTSSFSCTIFSDMVCYLLSEWCLATSFYQSSANLVSFYPLFFLRNLFYLI